MSLKRSLEPTIESGNDNETMDKGREVKVKLEPHDDNGDDEGDLVRTCVVCLKTMVPGEESKVCSNQLASSSSSSSSSSSAGVKLRGDHSHCLECYKIMPVKQCGVCKGPFFASSADGKIVDLTSSVPLPPPPPKQQAPAPPVDPYAAVLREAESKELPPRDVWFLAVLRWENNRCQLLQGHEPQFVASFLNRLVAANQIDLAIYILLREERNILLALRVAEHPNPNPHPQDPAALQLTLSRRFATIISTKLSLFLAQTKSLEITRRIFQAYRKYFSLFFTGSAFPVPPFPRDAAILRMSAGFVRSMPRITAETLGRWFCAVVKLGAMDQIQQVLDDAKQVAPMLPLLNEQCFTYRMANDEGLFVTADMSPQVFASLAQRFPWLVKVAWNDFRLLTELKFQYHPLAWNLYTDHYAQVPQAFRCAPRLSVGVQSFFPANLDPWSHHYLFDPVAVKWFCAPHMYIHDKNHHFDVEGPHLGNGTRITIMSMDKPEVEPQVEEIKVKWLHVFYFARVNADGTNYRKRGEATFWDIPDDKYNRDRHTGWRYWAHKVIRHVPGSKRLPLNPGTTFYIDLQAVEHELSLVNVATF